MSGRRILMLVVGLATAVSLYLVVRRTGASAVAAAIRPDWLFLGLGFAIIAGVQPLRAWAWSSTVRSPVGFRAMYVSSAIGSFLDTVLPGRLGEVSKVAVLKVAAGTRYPGFSRAGGSLLCAHLLEMVAFAVLGAAGALFLPVPGWARVTLLVGLTAPAAGLVLLAVVHRRFGRRLPRGLDRFLAGANAPSRVMAGAAAILFVTWVARWFGVLFLLHAVGLHVSIGAALLYMVVTGLANTAPVLPGNAGIYQGAAIGALALMGQSGAHAVAASLLTPVVVSLATAAAAAVGLASYGRRFAELPRAALTFRT
jgi:uncharacterized membrane protein YbhN (UPF0104 family)